MKIVALDYVLLGDYPHAHKWLTRSLAWSPKDSESWYYLGRTKYNENRFAEAVSAFEQCLKLDPKNVKAEGNLGLSFAGLGLNEEAATAYQTAIAWQSQLLVKNPGPYIDLGSLLLDENKTDVAISNLFQAVEISPRDSKPMNSWAGPTPGWISCGRRKPNWKKPSTYLPKVRISTACWPPSIESRDLPKRPNSNLTAALPCT